MNRTAINPWDWSLQYGFNQGELVEGYTKTLFLSGQTAIDENGAPQHAGDIRAQAGMAIAGMEAVLKEAGMTLANVVRFTIYTTDVDAAIQHFDAVVGPFAAAGVKPAQTLIGVQRLAFPDLMIELEATAVA